MSAKNKTKPRADACICGTFTWARRTCQLTVAGGMSSRGQRDAQEELGPSSNLMDSVAQVPSL